ncbi:hypothetical protein M9H77_34099 [Catharanthus roseus]|uniref:Uncharacterized protein n=1 Tax=Catharanthus roseus TaxID=4058 RepID=A0ACB9ZKB6_CATRO|nr:hypothetical protein M9H77_34099 [Catharanthus roseus]
MTEELKPKGHQTRKWTPNSGNAVSRHRRQSKATKKTGEQQRGTEHRTKRGKQRQSQIIRRKPRVSKTPKDREWKDGSEEESKILHKNRSNNSNKKRRQAVHPRVANGRPGWPIQTARASL